MTEQNVEQIIKAMTRAPDPACEVITIERAAAETMLRTHSVWREADAVIALRAQQPTSVAVPDEILRISELIRSQDNRGTDQPMFAVLEKREVITLDTHDHDRIVWVETGSGDYCEADDRQHNRLEILHHAGRDCDGWARYAVTEVDVFVTCCFTEQGCKDFLDRDGHNLRKPYIYAFGSYRNDEYQSVRKWLAAAPHPVGGEQNPVSEHELDAAGLGYPLAKEKALELWYSGIRSEPITVLEAWEAIGHDTGCNPSKRELLESLRNMAAICDAHGCDSQARGQHHD